MSGGTPFWADNLSTEPYKVVVGTAPSTKTFYLHPRILRQASPFFKALLEFPGKEQEERIIELPDDDVDAFALFIRHAYTGAYTLPYLKKKGEKLLLQTKLYILADKMLTTDLKLAALGNMVGELIGIRLPVEEQETPLKAITPAEGRMFGWTSQNSTPKTSGGLFSHPANTTQTRTPTTSGGLFGDSPQIPTPTRSGGLFGHIPSTTSASSPWPFFGEVRPSTASATAGSTSTQRAASPAYFSTPVFTEASLPVDNTPPSPDDMLLYIYDVVDALYSHFSSPKHGTESVAGSEKNSTGTTPAISNITSLFGDRKQIFKLGYDPAKLLLARFCASKLAIMKDNRDFIQLMARHPEFLQDVLGSATVSASPVMKVDEHFDKNFLENLRNAGKRGD